MTAARRGRLIALEGIDGTGKSTLLRRLARALRQQGWSVAVWREPSNRALGRRAQELGAVDPTASAVGFTLDRIIARPRLERLLRNHEVVLSDRSLHSTLAYQGSALPPRTRRALAALQQGATVPPDRVLWLALPAREALARVEARGGRRAPLERRRTLERVARAYAAAARNRGWWTVDAGGTPDEVFGTAYRLVRAWLPSPAGSQRRRRGA